MPSDNRLPSYETLLEFQEVYLRAIALSWRDDEFKVALLENSEDALERYFGYKCPWNIKVTVREPDYEKADTGWHPATKTEKGYWSLPKCKIIYGIPSKPKHMDVGEQVLALAAYNDAGPTYLFTCT